MSKERVRAYGTHPTHRLRLLHTGYACYTQATLATSAGDLFN